MAVAIREASLSVIPHGTLCISLVPMAPEVIKLFHVMRDFYAIEIETLL